MSSPAVSKTLDPSVRDKKIAVLGGGIVGVCAALEFQTRGANVVLLDRGEPGHATSFGNAGVLARSSLMPINNPGILADLPSLLSNTSASLRYDPKYVLSNLSWACRFLLGTRKKTFDETTGALDALIRLSIAKNLELIKACDETGLLSEKGWIFLYRTIHSYRRAGLLRKTMRKFKVGFEELDRHGLHDLEPDLAPIFPQALWIRDSYSVNNPLALVKAYTARFSDLGGTVERGEATFVSETSQGVQVHLNGGETITADKAALCMGPWSKSFLEKLNLSVPMAFERGYHMHYTGFERNRNSKILRRPVCDTQGGYVLSSMERGLRLSTGVELAPQSAPANHSQLDRAELAAREAFPLGERMDSTPWLGSRPTLPDSRPAIGAAPSYRHVFLAFGHQHIGLATGSGTADVLVDLVEGKRPIIDARPFDPARVIRRAS